MFKKYYLTITILLITLTGCQDMSVQPTIEPAVVKPTAEGQIDYKKAQNSHDLVVGVSNDLSSIKQELLQQAQINQQLETRLNLLQQQYDELMLRVNRLLPNQIVQDVNIDPYDQAVLLYQHRQYGQVIQVLQPYNSAGNNDENASKALWLIIQAHYHLQHCESVMTSVKQFNNRFPKDKNLPNAWLLMAECQSKMQQRDIARETLRFIIRAYPDSLAAQKAKKQLDRK